jgi:hypothetical protein
MHGSSAFLCHVFFFLSSSAFVCEFSPPFMARDVGFGSVANLASTHIRTQTEVQCFMHVLVANES